MIYSINRHIDSVYWCANKHLLKTPGDGVIKEYRYTVAGNDLFADVAYHGNCVDGHAGFISLSGYNDEYFWIVVNKGWHEFLCKDKYVAEGKCAYKFWFRWTKKCLQVVWSDNGLQ